MLAILPIRAGSLRVKHKNITLINGKPLYMYIVNTLKNVDQIDKIIINTDYEIIKESFINDPRVNVMDRDKKLRGNCDINLVIQKVLEKSEGELFLQTHATNPLLSAETINSAIDYFQKHKDEFDSLFSVTKVQKRFWSDKPEPVNHSLLDEPTTQNLVSLYEENSCFYIFSRTSFEKHHNRIGSTPYIYSTPKIESVDIDDMEDLELVTRLLA